MTITSNAVHQLDILLVMHLSYIKTEQKLHQEY